MLPDKNFFIDWYKAHGRIFPWRMNGVSPFAFLITEMLLRQTRAVAVAKLWEAFTSKYSDALTLARAEVGEIASELKVLGLSNQRAKALTFAAQWLVEHHKGQVPNKLGDLLKIPHVGDYAARAVMCFAFIHRVEIVDANVLRLFSRYYGQTLIPDARCNPHVWEWARGLLPQHRKSTQMHNYGLLDFTAEICKPGRPRCEICPLSPNCMWGKQQVAKLG